MIARRGSTKNEAGSSTVIEDHAIDGLRMAMSYGTRVFWKGTTAMGELCSRFVRPIRPLCAGLLATIGLVTGCIADDDLATGESRGEVQPAVHVDPRRSLVVTEQAILARFPLQRVLDQLVAQSGVAGLDARGLFHQWWDTQNPGPGLGAGPHCNDVVADVLGPVLNGFPYPCRAEGALAAVDPFINAGTNPDEYIPIALFNRFDLTPGDASNCGEYRIVYARRAGQSNTAQRNLIIFEMALANPHPQQELKGCRKIVDFWAGLTDQNDVTARADALEQFYFTGIPSIDPVVSVDHLGGGPTGAGQIRTNQFIQETVTPRIWDLREFKLRRTCSGTTCTAMTVVPVTVKTNPFGGLFRADSPDARAPAFQAAFLDQVPALAASDLASIDFAISDTFNAAQSPSSGTENNYVTQLAASPGGFRDQIAARLAAIGSALTPEDVVARAQALSCAGCHRLDNNLAIGGGLVWPASAGFVHVSERDTETVDGQPRFVISPALVNAFLPKRQQVMEDYLNDKLKKPKNPADPIGGRRVH